MPALLSSSEEWQGWDLKPQFGVLWPQCSLPPSLDRKFWRQSPTSQPQTRLVGLSYPQRGFCPEDRSVSPIPHTVLSLPLLEIVQEEAEVWEKMPPLCKEEGHQPVTGLHSAAQLPTPFPASACIAVASYALNPTAFPAFEQLAFENQGRFS